ncbi:MAG: adenylate/guanylate cyclase domain-containing protein [Nitrosomonadales bacterium]|nr:adenylate/guanylate cyclase domain-containing protein [Nitrosomonadales bacterium]
MVSSLLKKIFMGGESRVAPVLLALVSVSVVVWLYYSQNSFFEAFEAKTYDLRFSELRGAIPPSPDIAIVAIDDKSIAELGRFPWTRTQYVRLIERLSAAGAKVLLVDAFFPERETAAVDRAFAAAVKKAGNVELAVVFDFDNELRVVGGTHTLPEIEQVAAGIGHINLVPEDDGVNRRNRLLVEADGKLVPSLGLRGAMAALGEKEFVPGSFEVGLGDRRIPVDGNYSMWINYTGKAGSYPRYSFTDIVNGRVAPEMLRGKVLFMGATALGVYDMRVTPFDKNAPGVELHATVADNIISNRFIRRTGLESLFDMALIVVSGLVTFYLTMRLRLYVAIPAAFLLSCAYVWLSYWVFVQGHWVSMIYPPLAVMVALLIGGSFRYLVLDRSAREMRSMFSSYLSPKLVDRLEKEHEVVRIGGDNKEVTVLFTDIRGFTSFSESRSPQEVVTRLNEYLGAMVQVIDRFDGTVDKFIGDGIMFYWGAPFAQPDHAKLAIACVLEMEKEMARLNAKWATEGVVPFSIRGGAQSGEVVAGNVGSFGKKMEYTLIGDTVNQSARLESAAKYYGVDFLIGEQTYLLTRDAYRYRELDRIRVVGKQIPVTIFELLGPSSDPLEKWAAKFDEALEHYRARRWDEAQRCIAAILEEKPGDRPSKIYWERCEHYKNNPPPEGWDGVTNRSDK